MKALIHLKNGIKHLYTDPINLVLGFIPLALSGMLYGYIGRWALLNVRNAIQEKIQSFFGLDTSSFFVGSFIFIFLFMLSLFVINWTFYLVTCIFAAPFNDLLSSRIEKLAKGPLFDNVEFTFKIFLKKFFRTIFNEFKKVIFVLMLSVLIMLMNFVPILWPVALILSALLVAASFLDYSWGRHDYTLGTCLRNIRVHFFTYVILGLFFLVLLSIPIVNVFVIPIGVSTFTMAFLDRAS